MRQYRQVKAKYPETILLFRLGDFFETFDDDALITSKVCGITLTRRNNGAAGEIPLAGFPHHQLDSYLPKIVRAGYRVAVCDQLEDPKQARGIVRRGVTEVVTPGVALYEKLLDTKKNNYVASITLRKERSGFLGCGLAAADVSTGEFFTMEIPADDLIEVLETLSPAEILINKAQKDDINMQLEDLSIEPSFTRLEEWIFDEDFARDLLLRHFKTKSLKGFGVQNFTSGLASAGAILHYLSETQQSSLQHIRNIYIFNPSEFMTLDYSTRRNLEITYSITESGSEGTLISILDKTSTAMGGRLFKKWITLPLRRLDPIKQRLEAVSALFDNQEPAEKLKSVLMKIGDLERLISKVCTGRANPRDLVSISASLKQLPALKEIISSLSSNYLNEISENIKNLDELVALIDKAIVEEPSTQLGGGNVFNSGYSEELDQYLEAKNSGKEWIANFRDSEREKTDIPSLKVGYNQVFGYYIEVTKVHSKKVPDNYVRKQTLTNAERYTTDELKDIESKILTAEEKIAELETELFTELREKAAEHTEDIQWNAAWTAAVDCLLSFALASREFNYVMPEIDDSDTLEIEDGRHPVVEKMLPVGESFTPNSTKLDPAEEQIHIITGPNMSGKSCYLRQVALIVLLGQIGCFVPAKNANFGLVDRIFTRVGAQDNITAGESTFLVEMHEAANILNNATPRSLVLLDEVGRGTATYDGISIAWAITEYLHNNIYAKTLFATHYHELNELASRCRKISNYQVEVIEAGSTIIFSHKVKPGTSDHSFGIYVAKMAGLPPDVLDRSQKILQTLEKGSGSLATAKADVSSIETKQSIEDSEQMAIFEFRDDPLREKLLSLKVNDLTPMQAMQVLSDIVKEAKRRKRR